jgi:carboxyl-terminal processing protease
MAQIAAAERGVDTTAVDSTLVFHTDAGRVLYGGGGIRPDVFVRADTFTTAQTRFIQVLGGGFAGFRDVISTYALELKVGSRLASPTFQVSGAMIDEVLRRLQARGTTVPDSVAAGARSLIARDLGYEAARYVFGREAEFRRRMGDDTQVQRGLALASRARTPSDLLALAATEPATRN